MSLKLQIRTQEHQNFWINTEPTYTVMQLKQEIAAQIHSSGPLLAMMLFLNGTKLGNEKTLMDYHLANGDTLNLIHKAGTSGPSGD